MAATPKPQGRGLRVLGIETSCDETSVAILASSGLGGPKSKIELLHHETATQIPIHRRYGGVVPEVAARTHVAEIISLLERAGVFGRGTARRAPASFDAIAVTRGPGLATALRVGIEAARTLAYLTDVPIVGVNHLEGHLASAWLVPENRERWKFPVLILLVSGGHSELVLMKDFCRYTVVGRTRDDASGEAFDKTAKLMGLSYPGGPILSRYAAKGNPEAYRLPRPMIHDPSLDMSFSGLKTAVRNLIQDLGPKVPDVLPDLCASIQAAIVDVLVNKTSRAIEKYRPECLAVVGGVSANPHLQKELRRAAAEHPGLIMLDPPKGFYTDNAAMIAAAGTWRLVRGKGIDFKKLDAEPELDL